MRRRTLHRAVVACTAVALALVPLACGGGNDHPSAQPNPGQLFPDRANQRAEDQERRLGESAMLAGYTTTVTEIEVTDDVPDDLRALGLDTGSVETVVVEVQVANRDDESQPTTGGDWTLVTPNGTVHEAESTTLAAPDGGPLAVGPGEQVQGEVTFVVDPGLTGDFYVVYKPAALDAAQGIWQLQVP